MCTTGTFVVNGRYGRDMKVNMDADINKTSLYVWVALAAGFRSRSSPGGIPVDLRFNSETRLTCLNHPRAASKVPVVFVSPSSRRCCLRSPEKILDVFNAT
jgi:hypothetical protein